MAKPALLEGIADPLRADADGSPVNRRINRADLKALIHMARTTRSQQRPRLLDLPTTPVPGRRV
jgi:hypothetical protein